MSSEDDRRRFHESLERVSRDATFYDRFYRHFIGSSDEIAAIFKGRDVLYIQQKLKTTLEMVANNADGDPGLDRYLEMLGRIHARLYISPNMFEHWRDALIKTAAESDPAFDEATERAWRRIIEPVVAKISAAQGSGVSRPR